MATSKRPSPPEQSAQSGQEKLPSAQIPWGEKAHAGFGAGQREGENFPIIGIGGSAGGFEAMGALLRALPSETGMAFALLQHLDPRSTSRYGSLFRRDTNMPIEEIADGLEVEPNHVYVLPPAVYAELSGRRFRVTRPTGGDHVRMPIDRFFVSLAVEEKHRAIGVVLSGTNNDGTGGLRAIREEGGITFAQSERSSKYFGMPGAAIAAGCVDFVLTPDQIATRLGQIARHPWVRIAPAEVPKMDEPEPKGAAKALLSIFTQLRQHSGVDFTLYKRSTIQRRITRRMVLSRLEKAEDYAKLLRTSPDELDALFDDLLINVTHFFRDKSVFTALQKSIFPKMLRHRREEGGDLRIWVAGCATGEEVYSLAIVAMETMRRVGIDLRVQIFGTDLSEAAINFARTGIYPPSIVNEVSAERLRRYFNKVDHGYQVTRSIRDACTFARQNICQDPPFSRIDFVSCRNVLIYLGQELQRRCIPVFHYALCPNGYLLLGSAETVGNFSDLFTLMDKRHKVYAKKVSPLRPSVDFGKPSLGRGPMPKAAAARREREHDLGGEIQKEADRIILHRLVQSGVVVDTQFQVIQFRGQTGVYLEHLSGEASLNLLQMVRPALAVDLRAAIHKAVKQNSAVRKEGIYFQYRDETLLVDIDVAPFKLPSGGNERWLLVLFQSRPVAQGAEFPGTEENGNGRKRREATGQRPGDGRGRQNDGRARLGAEARLRDELRATKESLQAIIEEQEATNEELKSANEEIESSNEELQSSNEELETAKEELQSTNEELQTLNEELNTRNLELAQLNNDLSNLLSSINLPIVMVDNALMVRRATPLAEKLFNLIPADIGRRLTDIKPNLKIDDLDKMIRHVVETLEAQEREVVDESGITYVLRIRPYRTRDNKIDGAVLTLMDIDPSQRTRANLELTFAAIQAAAETAGGAVMVLDPEFRVRVATARFREAFGLEKEELVNRPIFDLADSAWRVPGLADHLRKTLQTSLRQPGRVHEQEYTISGRPIRLRISALGSGAEQLLILNIQNAPAVR